LLARLLLEKPDLLMLDEPTNHLDIEAVEWLEHTLQEWSGAVLIVSHDRYFLDNAATTIWEMTRTGIQEYSGNYNAYLLQRQEKWEYYERVFKEEKARLLNEVDFIERNWVRASTHARALGRLRRLSREIAIVENFGILALRGDKKWIEMDLHVERRLDVVEAVRAVNAISMQSNRPACIRPRLTSNQVSGNIVLRLDQVTIGYPGNPLFSTRNAELRRGECVALLGPNGSGKTSLVKTLLGQIEPLKGSPHLGASLKIGYFAQAHDGLQGDQSVLDELNSHKEMLPEKARSYLAAYLFRGDDIFKPLNALSGGERARLALAFMALDGANFLLLDEPTNHLDIPAQEALQEVLQNFNGTILLISHDRYFIDSLATHIWEIQGKELHCFHGRYREYILSRTAAVQSGQPRQVLLTPKPILRGNEKAVRKQVQNLNLLEERIRTHEISLTRLYNLVQKAYERNATEQSQRLNTEIARTQAELELLIHEWEALAIQTT
jgi:ATP-binding cassette subfamily F protein 3